MPPSQLKRLKESLRAEGILGPQQSKKHKQRDNRNGANRDRQVQRAAALRNIREQFNPFEIQQPSRGKDKFDITSNKTAQGKVTKGVKGRPGVTKGHGEETRRRTLLKEMQQRNRVGGIVDRRFGEDDPTMTPEEKILQRFTKEKQRRFKHGSIFNLEDDEESGQLTHFGQSLSADKPTLRDDFDEDDLNVSDDEDGASDADRTFRKRKRQVDSGDEDLERDEDSGFPERKKSRGEIMKEIVAKSKYHKYERQQAKEDDEEERERLDKELPGLLALMKGRQESHMGLHGPIGSEALDPDRAALIAGNGKSKDQEYDMQVKQMALDRRSKPAERTKTDEEKANEEAARLKKLEEERLRRMRGEEDDTDDEDGKNGVVGEGNKGDPELDDAEAFGFGAGIAQPQAKHELDVEDEDEFFLDGDLIASGTLSDLTGDDETSPSRDSSPQSANDDDDDDDGFLEDTLGDIESEHARLMDVNSYNNPGQDLAYTFPCPQTLEDWLGIVKDIPSTDLSTAVQRIRTLYNPQLHSDNKAKLCTFATVLLEYIVYISNQPLHLPLSVLGLLIRHLHSLTKTYPVAISKAFRTHLESVHKDRPTSLTPGDMVVFTAIGHIFPTSDHFHQVMTPAMLCMTRYLSQKRAESLNDLVAGAYIGTLCLQYQRLSKRYIPELMTSVLNAICNLSPVRLKISPSLLPYHETAVTLRLRGSVSDPTHLLRFWDILPQELSAEKEETLKQSLFNTFLTLLIDMSELWASQSAYIEVFDPALLVLQHLEGKASSQKLAPSINVTISKAVEKLRIMLRQARISRRPLELHHHRPLAIKSSIPKFEESYNPDKHYDHNQDRKELGKLKAEYKREKKGALRELRKDANFIARETLREKKEKDREYEKKFKRLIGEIQGEEGREAKLYEREKRLRKKKR